MPATGRSRRRPRGRPLARDRRRHGRVDVRAGRGRHRGRLALAASHVLRGVDHALAARLPGRDLRRLGGRPAGQPEGELGAARGDRNEHQRAVEGRLRARAAATRTPARTERSRPAVGYVVTELAKEAPYYAGAFGAALLSDSVSSNDALVFLAGANLGAAAYEYGLARLTQPSSRRSRRSASARHRARAGYASFDTDWVPRDYLADYYSVVEPDERAHDRVLRRRHEARRARRAGPALRRRADAPPRVPGRRQGLGDPPRRVPAGEPARDRALARRATPTPTTGARSSATRSNAKGSPRPTDEQVARARGAHAREDHAAAAGRRATGRPAGGRRRQPYGTVISAYCADSATDDRATWETYMAHIAGLVRPGGVFITAALRRSPRLPRRRQGLPERERRRERHPRGPRARVRERARIDRGARAARARIAGLLGHRARLGPPARARRRLIHSARAR